MLLLLLLPLLLLPFFFYFSSSSSLSSLCFFFITLGHMYATADSVLLMMLFLLLLLMLLSHKHTNTPIVLASQTTNTQCYINGEQTNFRVIKCIHVTIRMPSMSCQGQSSHSRLYWHKDPWRTNQALPPLPRTPKVPPRAIYDFAGGPPPQNPL